MTLPAGSQSLSMGGMKMRAQGMDGRKKAAGPGNWLGLSGTTTANWAIDGAVDGQGNLFLSGDTSGELLVARYAPDGQREWSVQVTGAYPSGGFGPSGDIGAAAIALDASGNVHAVSGNASTTCETRKYSPGGQLLWGRTYTAGTNTFGRSVAVGASGSVYVLMRTDGGGFGGSTDLVVKYNAAGAFQWSRNVATQSKYALALDASENVYVGYFTFFKLNSAGALQWATQKTAGLEIYAFRMTASASGNTYAVGNDFAGLGYLYAFDTSGNVAWARSFGATGTQWNDVVLSGQSLFCIGTTTDAGAGAQDIVLAEYDTSGVLKWQRTIGGAGADYGLAIAEADANSLAIFGRTSLGAGSGDVFIGRIPKSGPPAGKIGPYTVTASSLPASTISSTYSAFSPLTQTLGSDAASSLTDSAVALTTNIYPL